VRIPPNETGTLEVFVWPFPDVDSGKWQVSTAGRVSPVWAHGGQELSFVNSDEELVSQAIVTGAAFRRGEQRVLFGTEEFAGLRGEANNYASFDVSPDDRRFLMVRRTARGGAAPTTTAVLVEHWLTELRGERRANR
jgi:hypothetical protein